MTAGCWTICGSRIVCIAALELARSLGHDVSDRDRERLIEPRQRIPSFDISDPFGGSREEYEATAAEIRTALFRLLDKLEADRYN